MSALLSNPTPYDSNWVEATVTSVDPLRSFCQVKTTNKQNLENVIWGLPSGGTRRSTDTTIPIVGDRVLIFTGLGYPVIVLALPRVEDAESFPVNIDTGQLPDDVGNYGPTDGLSLLNPNKPGDMVSGDRVIASEGGGLFGVLRGGSILLKSSRLAQIFITKYDDLVRLVARNYELFTDACIEIAVNIRGRIYRFKGYTDTLVNARQDLYKYQEHTGDTALSEFLKGNYANISPSLFPAANSIVRKDIIVNASQTPLMTRTIDLNGEVIQRVQLGPSSDYTVVQHNSALYLINVVSGTYSKITMNPASIVIDHNGQDTITMDASQIFINRNGVSKVTLTDASVVVDHGGQSVGTFDGSRVNLNFGGTTNLNLNSAGMQMTFGGHSMTMDSAGMHIG